MENGSNTPSGSINSAFQFVAYKVDSLQLNMKKNLEIIEAYIAPSASWDINIQFRQPYYYCISKQYIGGLDIVLSLYPKDIKPENKSQGNALIYVQAGIAGVFKIIDSSSGRFSKEVEDGLVKYQIPAILLPYLRGTISTLLSTGGYGAFIFPLINIQQMVSDSKQGMEVKIIEEVSSK